MANTPKPVNVLYLGMAFDIFQPLLLFPDFTTLYAMNRVDEGYGTWEQQKEIIRTHLTYGKMSPHSIQTWLSKTANYTNELERNSNHSYTDSIRNSTEECEILPFRWSASSKNVSNNNGYIETACFSLPEPAFILSDEEDSVNEVWRLEFLYLGKVRELIYYYDFDFMKEWPKEIQNISHITWVGAYAWQDLPFRYNFNIEKRTSIPVKNNNGSKVLRTMLETRTTPDAYIYEIDYGIPYNRITEYGKLYTTDTEGVIVTKRKLNFTNKNGKPWWKGGRRRTTTRNAGRKSQTLKKQRTNRMK